MAAISIKCPHCGGELVFEPSSQNYQCPYCASAFSQSEVDAMLGDPETPGARQTEGQQEADGEGVVYNCPSCGAQIVTDATTAATFCYYCHNPVVLGGRISGAYLPDRIIPFKIDREEAVSRFLQYVGKKRYVPKAFFSESQVEKLTGVYYPYWVYDSEIDGSLQAEATRVRVWRAGDVEYTRTSVFHVEREGRAAINHLTRNALRKTAGELVEKVQPYDLSDMTDFSMGYLAGFMAEKRDLEKGQFQEQLREEAGRYAGQLLRDTADGYSSLRVTADRYVPAKETYYYTLLPVWVLTYKSASGRLYYYAMNGQTAAVAGELPLDTRKLLLHSLLLGLAVIALLLVVSYFWL